MNLHILSKMQGNVTVRRENLVSPLSGFNTSLLTQSQPLTTALPANGLTSAVPTVAPIAASVPATPVASTGLANNASGMDAQAQAMLVQVVNLMMCLVAKMTGQEGGNAFAGSAALPAPAASAPASVATPAAKPNTTGRLRIAQIDNFTADNTGFNHGNEIANSLRNGGGDPNLSGKVDLLQFDVSGNVENKTVQALQNVIQRVQSGEQVDAVNMSLQDFANNGNTQQVRALVDQLSAMGVPVAVAAGNDGPGAVNQLGTGNSFNVQSATNGRINGTSGRGNVTAEGRTTSFATANLTPLLAAMKASGQSLSQIHANV